MARGPTRTRHVAWPLLGTCLLVTAWPRAAPAQSATASLEVNVATGCRGGPASEVELLLRCPGIARRLNTDRDGRATFAHLWPGPCRIEARRPDGAATGEDVSVSAGAALCTSLSLGEGCPPTPRPRPRPVPGDHAWSVSADDRRRTPRPTDVWSVLRDVPGVVLDRVDVGGSETAQQSLLVSHADAGSGVVWTLDGVDVTDPAALGSTAVYPDLDALEEVVARTGASDVRVRTPGLQVGLFLRAPRDRVAGRLHLRGSGDALQADNLPAELKGRPFFRNRTESLVELGGELGGPFQDGRMWLWGAASHQALRQTTFTEHAERLSLTSVTARGRMRLGAGTLSLLALRSEKVHEDRDSGLSAAREARWRQSGPAHVFAVEDQRRIGGASVLTRLARVDGGFRLVPQGDSRASPHEDFRGVFQGSYLSFDTERPRLQAGIEVAGQPRWLGRRHELTAGAGYRRSRVTTRLAWPGNQVLALERQSVFFRTFRLTGFALPTRDQHARSEQDQLEVYVQDGVRLGRFGVSLGLRLDRLTGRNLASAVAANPEFPDLLPAVSYSGAPPRFRWLDVLPRAGLAWDASGDGRSVARISYAAYAAPLGAGDVTFDNPVGRDYASLSYYWIDRNGDRVVQAGELDLLRGLLGSSNVDPRQPGAVTAPHAVDPDLRAPRTHEGALAVEHSFGPSLEAGARFSVRRSLDLVWRPLRGLTLSDYAIRGAVRGTLFGREYTVGYFAPASESKIVPGNGRLLTNRQGYHRDAFNLDLSLRARLGPRLRLGAWLGVADWRERFDDTRSLQDPTSQDFEPLQHNGRVAVRPGGLGRGDVFVQARWTAALTVSAELPWGLAATAHVHARDGFPIPYIQVANSGDPTGGAKNVLVSPHLDSFRLPAPVLLDARLARSLSLAGGSLAVEVDAFNLLNRGTALQVARDVELPLVGRPREVLRPRIVRLGLRYEF